MTDIKPDDALYLNTSRQDRIDILNTEKQWDIIVIGGGITGAGIFKFASQLGMKALLIEQQDFAWGSSSKSSKMVHGGLRYLAKGQGLLALESVKERQRLLKEARFLVTQENFVMGHYKKQFPWPWIFNLLLTVYDFLAGKRQHKFWSKSLYKWLVPAINDDALIGGTQFVDAITDDARLVLRLLQEAQQLGGVAINYTKATDLISNNNKITGVNVEIISDAEQKVQALQLSSKCIVNASGAWSDKLVTAKDNQPKSLKIRPLRGSHLVIPNWRLPVACAVSVLHPEDKRPVQIYPWQNMTIVGTTDVEHKGSLINEPNISQTEFTYLLDCVDVLFPHAKLSIDDIVSTFAGVRPVISCNKNSAPSAEKREHYIAEKSGFISVAGGKLTTFRTIAKQVIKRVNKQIKHQDKLPDFVAFQILPAIDNGHATKQLKERMLGLYGDLAPMFLSGFSPDFFKPIAYSRHVLAELLWALKYEQVFHLDDLLLRRTRIGNVLPNGGLAHVHLLKSYCDNILGWDEQIWQKELERYKNIINNYYSVPSNVTCKP
ncbi:glycerol-3-phosphate dehydrogenase/oxidase [Colwelliaceae bacterium 6471]